MFDRLQFKLQRISTLEADRLVPNNIKLWVKSNKKGFAFFFRKKKICGLAVNFVAKIASTGFIISFLAIKDNKFATKSLKLNFSNPIRQHL